MDPIRTVRLRWLHGNLSDVTYQLTRVQFSHTPLPAWRPAVNAYRCEKSIRVCVDLAGVDRSQIDLTIAGRRLSIRGMRDVPDPKSENDRVLQMIEMEIDYGPFERVVLLPEEVEVDFEKVHAEQKNGFVWIELPVKQS